MIPTTVSYTEHHLLPTARLNAEEPLSIEAGSSTRCLRGTATREPWHAQNHSLARIWQITHVYHRMDSDELTRQTTDM